VAIALFGAACGGTTPEGSARPERPVEASVEAPGVDGTDDGVEPTTEGSASDLPDAGADAGVEEASTRPSDPEDDPTVAPGDDGEDEPQNAATGDSEAGDDATERPVEPGAGDADQAAQEQQGTSEAPRRSVFAWILGLGPSAPTGPSAFRAYRLLAEGDCQGLLDRFDPDHPERLSLADASATLYRGAAAACLAAFHDEVERWADAEQAASAAGVGDGGCLDRAVSALLADLLAAHRDDPAARFERSSDPTAASAPPCPTLLEVVPAAGPPGTDVRLRGEHLAQEGLRVDIYDHNGLVVEVVPTVTDRELVVTVDGSAAPGTVCLALHATPDWYADGVTFEVLAEGQETPGPGSGGALPCPPTP
jgi:hypothetical protein